MGSKKLLAAFLLGVGLCFVPALGYGEVKRELYEAKYYSIYEVRSEEFLNEMERQVYKSGSLSVTQRKALNQMHRRFNKRIENKA